MPSPKTERACEGCGELFMLRPKQRWHSKECHGKYAMEQPRRKFICANPECRLEYEKSNHQIGAGTGEFHSIACANKARAIDEVVRFNRDSQGVGTEPAHVPGIGPCVEWTSGLTKDGYGAFAMANGRQIQAHIYSWQLANGPVPKGLCVCHRCDNRACLRIDHLFLGTRAENNEDRDRKDRTTRGEAKSLAKLTEAIVRTSRVRYAMGNVSQQQLADEHDVSQTAMGAALRGKTWRHVL